MPISHGPLAGLPAGYARVASATSLERGHSPGLAPHWFGPAIGTVGGNRFDLPTPRAATDPGVCYLAERLLGALHERVFRGVHQPSVSRTTLSAHHAITPVATVRDLVLIDLVAGISVHGLQLHDITALPNVHPAAPLRYPATQGMAGAWASTNAASGFPVPGGRVDGILYVSRFGANEACLALWDIAAPALGWGTPQPLGSHPGLVAACNAIGVVVVP